MGNTFGNYASRNAAEAELLSDGYQRKEYPRAAGEVGVIYAKPSTNGVTGAPQTALVQIIEQTVDPKYGQPNYFQHEYI